MRKKLPLSNKINHEGGKKNSAPLGDVCASITSLGSSFLTHTHEDDNNSYLMELMGEKIMK